MKKRRLLFLLGGLACVVAAALPVLSCRVAEVGLVDGRLRNCPDSPNCVCSVTPDSVAFVAPLAFEGDADAAFRSLIDFLSEEPRVTLEESTDTYVHAVFRTRILRFRDDVEFHLDRGAGVIQVRSASRVGYSDLGTNRARIESIRDRWIPPEGARATPKREE